MGWLMHGKNVEAKIGQRSCEEKAWYAEIVKVSIGKEINLNRDTFAGINCVKWLRS